MREQFFQCPYCWEETSVLLDDSIPEQSYIEDCGICCNPIRFHVQFSAGKLAEFITEKED